MTTPLVELVKRLPSRLDQWAPIILAQELMWGVDPYVLAAIIDQESNGGQALKPQGPGGTGDNGHGRGLGQIDDRYHKSFVSMMLWNGSFAWRTPQFNITYAAGLLRSNLDQLGGDYLAAIAAYNCGVGKVREVLTALGHAPFAEQKVASLDGATYGGKYLSRVIARRDSFLSSCQPV